MSKFVDLTGNRFGAWTVVKFLEMQRGGSIYACVCDCGIKRDIYRSNLISGKTKSCGCQKSQAISNAKTTHGQARTRNGNSTRLYGIWSGMLNRCTNPNNRAYLRYGGRGVSVCERWRKFENFAADMGDPQPWESIDRIDNDGNYEPSNCRWETATGQARNNSRTRLNDEIAFQIRAGTLTAKEVAAITGCSHSTYYAVKRGVIWK